MTIRPAVADGGENRLLARLTSRLIDFLEQRDGASSRLIASRLLPAEPSGAGDPNSHHQPDPIWLRLPAAIALGASPSGDLDELLDDTLWAQYCLYCLFRLQDDVVDGCSADTHLTVAANCFLIEAQRAVRRHFDDTSPVWQVFEDGVNSTSEALVAIDRRQRDLRFRSSGEVALYADLAASLKVATAAIVFRRYSPGAWSRSISPALDHLAVAAQILDDLEDIEQDLARGQINYAAWYLGRPLFDTSPDSVGAVVASRLASGRRPAGLFRQIAHRLTAATAVLGSACPPMAEALASYRIAVDRHQRQVSERRRALLAPALRGCA